MFPKIHINNLITKAAPRACETDQLISTKVDNSGPNRLHLTTKGLTPTPRHGKAWKGYFTSLWSVRGTYPFYLISVEHVYTAADNSKFLDLGNKAHTQKFKNMFSAATIVQHDVNICSNTVMGGVCGEFRITDGFTVYIVRVIFV
jgi:hypothetical protein